jgi:D-arginine dehydrogenase
MQEVDVVICGAGIAGASLAWRLAGGASRVRGPREPAPRVLLLEREAQAGVHATGRSAAMFMESYGPPQVRALTRASRDFYTLPPPGFTTVPLLHRRGVLYVATPEQLPLLEADWAEMQHAYPRVQRLSADEALARVPCLRADRLAGAIAEPDATDLDVHALHQGFLQGARFAGVGLRFGAELVEGRCAPDGGWSITLADGSRLAAATLVNAAGAWADELAQRCGVAPLGLEPRRRSAFTFRGPEGVDSTAWPAVVDIEERWYFKPDAGHLLGSPANADPTHPHDVQPEALDIATGIHGIESATTLTIPRPIATWAGLRTFAPDGEIVIGPDAAQPAFFWLAGQGGYGLQSAAGASLLAATLLRGEPLPADLAAQGVSVEAVSPRRFARP